ncbi:MAG: DUF4105 domain-containing protein [Bdellovibrionota bacterium]
MAIWCHQVSIRHIFIVLLLCFVQPDSSLSASTQSSPLFRPADPSRAEFHLLTVGLGSALYMRFGHTILQLVDLDTGNEYNFNWGIFDFDDPDFAYKYFTGRLLYRVGVSNTQSVLAMYKYYEKRKVWKEKINLTVEQKQKLLDRIFWNLKKENRTYLYQHFYNNCSTKVRDYLNEALGGKIKQAYGQQLAALNFRDYVRANLSRPAYAGFGLDIIMNRKIDEKISLWDEMFYPSRLRDLMLKLPAFDDEGNEVAGSSLLSGTQLLVDNPDYAPIHVNIYSWIALFFGVPLIAVMLVFFVKPFALSAVHKVPVISIRVLGGVTCLWALFAGALGTVMFVSWLLSDHLDILHNANLWAFWPIDFLMLPLGYNLIRHGAWRLKAKTFTKVLKLILLAHLSAALIYWLLWAMGFLLQNVRNVMIYLLPLGVLLYIALYKVEWLSRKSGCGAVGENV